ncbi:unnamed protein product [Heterobilharzia americana]|nr:unnamed protein product [Heterobilharzia americana]
MEVKTEERFKGILMEFSSNYRAILSRSVPIESSAAEDILGSKIGIPLDRTGPATGINNKQNRKKGSKYSGTYGAISMKSIVGHSFAKCCAQMSVKQKARPQHGT